MWNCRLPMNSRTRRTTSSSRKCSRGTLLPIDIMSGETLLSRIYVFIFLYQTERKLQLGRRTLKRLFSASKMVRWTKTPTAVAHCFPLPDATSPWLKYCSSVLFMPKSPQREMQHVKYFQFLYTGMIASRKIQSLISLTRPNTRWLNKIGISRAFRVDWSFYSHHTVLLVFF